MVPRGPFLPLPFCDSVILSVRIIWPYFTQVHEDERKKISNIKATAPNVSFLLQRLEALQLYNGEIANFITLAKQCICP